MLSFHMREYANADMMNSQFSQNELLMPQFRANLKFGSHLETSPSNKETEMQF